MDKRDYLGECNEHAVPEEDFRASFCVRCLQTECSRSAISGSLFEQRVSTWAERLFLSVPRLDPDDPRYAPIAGQKFVTIDTGRTPEVQRWVDPLEVKPEPVPEPVPEPSAQPAPVGEPKVEPKVTPPRLPRHMVLANAPDQSGRMLSGAPSTPQKDPWATPEPTESAGTVVSAGAVIKIGRSGV